MRRTDVQGELADNFEPSPLAITPDGGIAVRPEAKAIPPPPRLCEAGPCVHYHCLAIQLDAEAPRGQNVEPGGKIVGLPETQPFYVEKHYYCYPTVGIELELGSLPVLQCNHWDPRQPETQNGIELRRETFAMSAAGLRYAAELKAWTEARKADDEVPEDPVRTWITMNMREDEDLDVHRDGNYSGPPLQSYTRDEAMYVTMTSLRNMLGGGVYILSIMTPDPNEPEDPDKRVRNAFKKVEVT